MMAQHFPPLLLQAASVSAASGVYILKCVMESKPKLCYNQMEVQQKIIADFEASKLAWDAKQAELTKEVPVLTKSLFNIF